MYHPLETYLLILVSLFSFSLLGLFGWLYYIKNTPNRLMMQHIKNFTTEAVLITNKNNQIIYANHALLELTGYTFDEIKGKNPSIFQSERKNSSFYHSMWDQLLKEGKFSAELWDKKKNGILFLKHISIFTIKNLFGKITHYMSIQRDITSHYASTKAKEDSLHFKTQEHLSSIKKASELVVYHINKQTPFYIIFVRISNHIELVKNYSSSFFNAARLQFSETIYDVFKSEATIGEYDDETLIIVSKDTTYKKPDIIKEIDALSKGLYINGQYISLENKYGLSHYPNDSTDVETLIYSTYTALNSALSNHKKYAIYNESFAYKHNRETIIQSHFHTAIKNNDFYVVYQPQYDLNNNEIIALEALLRWKNPPIDHCGPQELIPIAERYGYIGALTFEVLKMVQKDLPKIHAHLPVFKVAINLSATLILDQSWLEAFKTFLEKDLTLCQFLEIEITESFLIEDIDLSVQTINDFQHLGLSISLDDFGSGFSSLSYLKTLPIDKIKIDKIFTEPLKNSDSLFTKSLIELVKTIDAKVLGEGVETLKQAEYLKAYGCDYAQGFYYSEPLNLRTLLTTIKP